MTEKLLQTIWAFQYFNRSELYTTTGELVEVVYPGLQNSNQGPDFLSARIKIGGTLLIGSVELHLKTSGWHQHGHGSDAHYNNVILHVVWQHDAPMNSPIPVLALEHRISRLLLQQYGEMLAQKDFIPCAASIGSINELTRNAWNERLVAERLTRKAKGIINILESTGNHWEETFWRLLARNFGAKVNSEAFEDVAAKVPVKLLAKHRNNLPQLEALLLGTAGLLPGTPPDAYSQLLLREYHFLAGKYNLQPASVKPQFLRMRPPNFPTVRLAQLAALQHGSEHLFSKMLEAPTLEKIIKEWQVTASEYWDTHYRFGEPTKPVRKKVGAEMVYNIIINTVVPVLFAYGLYHRRENVKEKAIHWLQQTAPETNYITKGFLSISVANGSAFESQALIELKNEWCNYRRCLQCAVGNALLKRWNG